MYETIVVGFDGSEYSKAALIDASKRAKLHGGKVVMVHAVYFDEEEFGIAPVQLEKRFEVGNKLCMQTREKYNAEFGIELESLVCQGEPPEIINTVARERGAGLIAMGTHGRRGIKRMIMGSVTASVIASSPCDVLVVKKPCSDCTGEYKSVLVAFDGSENSKKALIKAGQLAGENGGEVTVLYAMPRYEEMIGFMRTESIKKSMFDEAEKVVEVARNTAAENGFTVATMVQEGSAADRVVDNAAKLRKDLIVMGTLGWTGVNKAIMGSTTERVIMNSPCPVLVVR
jgi:nucleotide-binding universal stress UspA family protein